MRAIRIGERSDGGVLAPAMPWRSYAALNDEDASALAQDLRSLPPARNAAPPMTGATEPRPAPYFAVVAPGR